MRALVFICGRETDPSLLFFRPSPRLTASAKHPEAEILGGGLEERGRGGFGGVSQSLL